MRYVLLGDDNGPSLQALEGNLFDSIEKARATANLINALDRLLPGGALIH